MDSYTTTMRGKSLYIDNVKLYTIYDKWLETSQWLIHEFTKGNNKGSVQERFKDINVVADKARETRTLDQIQTYKYLRFTCAHMHIQTYTHTQWRMKEKARH